MVSGARDSDAHFGPILILFAVIPNVMIEPPDPYHIFKGNSTLSKGGSDITNRIPDVGGTRQTLRPPYVPAIVTERPVTRPTTRPTPGTTTRPTPGTTTRLTPKPTTRYVPVTTRQVTKPVTRLPQPPQPTTLRPTLPPQRTPLITEEPSRVPTETTSSQGITDDNRIQIDPQKPRGDVFSK